MALRSRKAPSPSSDYLAAVFGKAGLLAKRVPGYRPRPGQLAIARTLDRAMATGTHAIAEGPTGTGKSLAYGVPAVYHAVQRGCRVVIATANIALQEQLATKDLPLLQELLPWPFAFTLLKGRSNYLCHHRLERGRVQLPLAGDYGERHLAHHGAILRWAQHTRTGDISELPFQPSPSTWATVSSTGEDCLRRDCKYDRECFYNRRRAEAGQAEVVVTNYHMLFAHLEVKRMRGQSSVLPEFELLVLDEAHEAPDIARAFFGFSLSARGIELVAKRAAALGFGDHAAPLEARAQALFDQIGAFAHSEAYGRRLTTPGFVNARPVVEALVALGQAAGQRGSGAGVSEDDRAACGRLVLQAGTLAAGMDEAVQQSDEGKVYWIDLNPRGVAKLRASLIDVGRILRPALFDAVTSVSVVSATLSIAGSFSFMRRELGVPRGALEVVAPSPFDFRKQAMLIVPAGLPDPRDDAFLPALAAVVREVIQRADGRTLGLFTSYRALDAVHQAVAGGPHRVLCQRDGPRMQLVEAFRTDERSVLLGTSSLWTGVDVAGPALSALVIDKLPFPHPDDPLVDAICARNDRAFAEYLLPRAIMLLRQGVGRLIRSEADVGVVVIADRRLVEAPYGARVRRSLPDMRFSRALPSIANVLAPAGAPDAVPRPAR